MIPFKQNDGLAKISSVIGALQSDIDMARHRIRVACADAVAFGTAFLAAVLFESLAAAMMLSILQIEVLGHVVSGALYALLVPIVIGAAHIKIHRDGDWFTSFWLKRLSTIGILFFAVAMSVMVAFAAWQAAEDSVSGLSGGLSGSIGGTAFLSTPDATSGLMSWIAPWPNVLLFIGLSFAMIVTIYFASFCLGRVIAALMLMTHGPHVHKEVLSTLNSLRGTISTLRKLLAATEAKRRQLPHDPKYKFARMAGYLFWEVAQSKLAVAARKFGASNSPDPLAMSFRDAEAETIPAHIEDYEEFARHIADQVDAMRLHRILRVLTGTPEHGDKK